MIRVVLVDSDEVVRSSLRTILQTESDLEVVGESGTAGDLDDLVDRTHPDVVLLDARLPGVGCAEATRGLTKSHPNVKVLIVSTYSDDQLIDECLAAGARGYIIKDIERFSLKQSIRAVHSGDDVLSAPAASRVLDRTTVAETPRQPPRFTRSQLEVLRLLGAGLSNREIASEVHLSENTVKTHVQEVFRKLGVRNRVEAAMLAHREGLI